MKRSYSGLSAIEMFIIGMVVLFSYAVAVADYVERVTYYPINSSLNNSGQQWSDDSAYAALYADSIIAYLSGDSIADYSGNHSEAGASKENSSAYGFFEGDTVKSGDTAFKFNFVAGSDSGYLRVPDVLQGLRSTVEGTWSAWVKTGYISDTLTVIALSDSGELEKLSLQILPTGKVKAMLMDSLSETEGQIHWACTTATAIDTSDGGSWSNIILTHNGTLPLIFINGAVDTVWMTTTSRSSWIDSLTMIDQALIGAECYDSLGHVNMFNGFIDEIIIEKEAWTAAEVTAYYADPDGYNTDYAGQIDNVSGYLYLTQFNPGYEAARRALSIQDLYGYFVAGFRATDTTGTPPNIRWVVQAKDTTDGNVWTDISDTGYSHTTVIDQADYGDIDTLKGYIATSTLEYIPAQFRMFFISDSANVSLAKWENKTYLDFRFKTTE